MESRSSLYSRRTSDGYAIPFPVLCQRSHLKRSVTNELVFVGVRDASSLFLQAFLRDVNQIQNHVIDGLVQDAPDVSVCEYRSLSRCLTFSLK
jgi:hypothetical protein